MKKWLLVATACTALLPGCAFAAIYDFQSNEISALGDFTYSFALNTADAAVDGTGTSFSGVTIDDSGTLMTGATVTLLAPTELSGPSFFFIDTDKPAPEPFGQGAGTNISFNPGSFTIADGFTDGEGVVDISNTSVSAAPEPTTWLLMFAGVCSIGLVLRRAKRRETSRLEERRRSNGYERVI